MLGYFPGHIHAFYLEYTYYKRRDEMRAGVVNARRAPGVFSERVQRGGEHGAPVVQQPGFVGGQQPAYGAVA